MRGDDNMRFAGTVVKQRVLILVITILLLIPAVLGMIRTRVNYDMLDYLPTDMDTVTGQGELLREFGKGAFSILIVEDMADKDVKELTEKIREVPHVDSVLWYSSIADLSIPKEMLPDRIYEVFNTDHSTAVAVFFDSGTSEDVTMEAVRRIREIAGKQCFVSGLSALVTDLKDLCEKEEPIYVGLAVACALAGCFPDLDRRDDHSEPGKQLFPRPDLLYHKSPFSGTAAGCYDGLFDLPVEQL